MDYNFVKSLTAEQKRKLINLLQEEPKRAPTPRYRVEVRFWDRERTIIESIREYIGNQRHGKCIGWYENGQKRWETDYVNGQIHGKR